MQTCWALQYIRNEENQSLSDCLNIAKLTLRKIVSSLETQPDPLPEPTIPRQAIPSQIPPLNNQPLSECLNIAGLIPGEHVSFRETGLLPEPTIQYRDTCWAESLAALLLFMLRLENPDLPQSLSLSVQDVLNQHRKCKLHDHNSPRGSIRNLNVPRFIFERGIVSSAVCPMSQFPLHPQPLNYERHANVERYRCTEYNWSSFGWHYNGNINKMEDELVGELRLNIPAVVAIAVHDSFEHFVPTDLGREVYVPLEAEKDLRPQKRHVMMCSGFGRTLNGIPYIECRENKGKNYGDNGFIRIGLGCNLLRDIVYMKV